jgi:ribonuclease-3
MVKIIRNVDDKIAKCEAIIKYTFTNKILLVEALNGAGPAFEIEYANTPHALAKNDDIGLVGESCMVAILSKVWWSPGGDDDEGKDWTKIRADNLSVKAVAAFGRKAGLDACVICNPGQRNVTDKIVAVALQAVLGMVMMDAGKGDDALGEVERIMRDLGICKHPLLPPLP